MKLKKQAAYFLKVYDKDVDQALEFLYSNTSKKELGWKILSKFKFQKICPKFLLALVKAVYESAEDYESAGSCLPVLLQRGNIPEASIPEFLSHISLELPENSFTKFLIGISKKVCILADIKMGLKFVAYLCSRPEFSADSYAFLLESLSTEDPCFIFIKRLCSKDVIKHIKSEMMRGIIKKANVSPNLPISRQDAIFTHFSSRLIDPSIFADVLLELGLYSVIRNTIFQYYVEYRYDQFDALFTS